MRLRRSSSRSLSCYAAAQRARATGLSEVPEHEVPARCRPLSGRLLVDGTNFHRLAELGRLPDHTHRWRRAARLCEQGASTGLRRDALAYRRRLLGRSCGHPKPQARLGAVRAIRQGSPLSRLRLVLLSRRKWPMLELRARSLRGDRRSLPVLRESGLEVRRLSIDQSTAISARNEALRAIE